ncbi:MAG TPA: hypothetical protein PLJ27_23840, partial [Polyangiaceae bacterium]|nr:hypothetical protein [Polyangiaceae bacterium]
ADTMTSLKHCGACNAECGTQNASSQCVSGSCQITCKAGFGDCDKNNANGCEADFSTNALHCGECGHSCLGSDCSMGYCVPKAGPTFPSPISDFAVSLNDLLVIEQNVLYRIPFGGTATLSTPATVGGHVVTLPKNSTYTAYYSSEQTEQPVVEQLIKSVTFVQPPVYSNVAIDTGIQLALAVTADRVYWSTSGYGPNSQRQIRYQSLGSNDGNVLVVPTEDAYSIALGSGYLYWPEFNGGRVKRISMQSTTITDFATSQNQPKSVVANEQFVCWISHGTKQVRCKTHSGTAVQTVADYTQQAPAEMTVIKDTFYWSMPDGSIHRWKQNETSSTTIVPGGKGSASLIRAYGDFVYWFDTSNKTIFRVAR